MRRAIQKHLRDFLAIVAIAVVAVLVGGYILSNQRFYAPSWVPLIAFAVPIVIVAAVLIPALRSRRRNKAARRASGAGLTQAHFLLVDTLYHSGSEVTDDGSTGSMRGVARLRRASTRASRLPDGDHGLLAGGSGSSRCQSSKHLPEPDSVARKNQIRPSDTLSPRLDRQRSGAPRYSPEKMRIAPFRPLKAVRGGRSRTGFSKEGNR